MATTPKHLTLEAAQRAVNAALTLVMGDIAPLNGLLNKQHCHIVIFIPEHALSSDRPNCLYRHDVGERSEWKNEYADIAWSKAQQLWRHRGDTGLVGSSHLLYSGDTPYQGGVYREGIVVACSGVQSYFDKMISGIVADILIGLATHAFASDIELKERAFI